MNQILISKISNKRITLIILLLFITSSIITFCYPPKYNWDLIGYSGVAQSYFSSKPIQIHRTVFSDMRKNIPQDKFYKIAKAGEYRRGIFNNPQYLINQLPFYAVKPLYPFLMATLKLCGLNFASGSIIISKISSMLSMVIIYFILSKFVSNIISAFIVFPMFSLPPVAQFSGWSTPDPLFAALFFAFTYFLLSERVPFWSYIFWPLLILARPDAIIFLVLLSIYFAIRRQHIYVTFGILTLVFVQYLIQSRLSGSYDWSTFFYHSFIESQLDPNNIKYELSVKDYIDVYFYSAQSFDTTLLIIWMLSSSIIVGYYMCKIDKYDSVAHLIILNLIYSGLHWALFPDQKIRILFFSYILVTILIIVIFANAFTSARKDWAQPGKK